jgi:hypothetical protein
MKSTDKKVWPVVVIAVSFIVIFWSQAIQVPFWQDDYIFLLNARTARLQNISWFSAFLPENKMPFWRPISIDIYWRFVETFLKGHSQLAHLMNVLLILASAAAVGWFVATLLKFLVVNRDYKMAGVLSAFLYGIHASHFIPVAWVAGANDSISVLFSALTLRYWIIVSYEKGTGDKYAFIMLYICFIMALLSKEIAFVLPFLGFLLTIWLWPQIKPSRSSFVILIFCLFISSLWLIIHERFTTPTIPEYEFTFGSNILRNAFSLFLFFFNTPREALRLFIVQSSINAAIWGAVSFILQIAAFCMLALNAYYPFKRRDIFILLVFFVIGCAPFFLLAWNCYEYYVSIGLFAYAIIVGLSNHKTKVFLIAIFIAVLSSTISTVGNYFLDYPSVMGRAHWAEKQLSRIVAMQNMQPQYFSGFLYIQVENYHKFLGFGVDGLAYRLGIDKKNVIIINPNDLVPSNRTVLVVPAHGDVYLKGR